MSCVLPEQSPARGWAGLSRVGFLKVVMIHMFFPSPLSLSLLPRAVSGSQRHLQVWQERSEFPPRRDSRPGLWDKASHGQRRLLEQGHQDDGPAPTKDTDQPQAGGTPQPPRYGEQGCDL